MFRKDRKYFSLVYQMCTNPDVGEIKYFTFCLSLCTTGTQNLDLTGEKNVRYI